MIHLHPGWIVLGGCCCLLLLLNERARIVAALAAFLFVALAAAQLAGFELKFWR